MHICEEPLLISTSKKFEKADSRSLRCNWCVNHMLKEEWKSGITFSKLFHLGDKYNLLYKFLCLLLQKFISSWADERIAK